MSRSISLLLAELVDAIERARRYTAGITYDAFLANDEKQDAVMRCLGIMGEAVKGLPSDFRARHASIEWRSIAGARDILVHEYFRVDLELTWQTIQQDLPRLEESIRAIQRDEGFPVDGPL